MNLFNKMSKKISIFHWSDHLIFRCTCCFQYLFIISLFKDCSFVDSSRTETILHRIKLKLYAVAYHSEFQKSSILCQNTYCSIQFLFGKWIIHIISNYQIAYFKCNFIMNCSLHGKKCYNKWKTTDFSVDCDYF